MRAFRYLDANGALLTIEQRALRVSRLHDLNDPFEWIVGVSDIKEEMKSVASVAAQEALRDLSSHVGVLCFSAEPDESVLWSHYADRHRGIVLEFELDDDPTKTVPMTYTDERPHVPAIKIGDQEYMRPIVDRLIRQKSTGWAYEREYRMYLELALCEARGGHYYQPFEPDCLRRVIVGWRSNSDVPYVQRALSRAKVPDVPVVLAEIQPHTYKVKC